MSSLPVLLILALLVSSAVADDNNVLLTGDVLTTDSTLSTPDATFVIQNDCNLVLYNSGSGFESDTSGFGPNCSLTLNNLGHLIINSAAGTPLWTTPNPNGPAGKYAAVLGPDNQVGIYGPAVWSTPPRGGSTAASSKYESELAATGIIPQVKNVLFSSQILYNNATLATRDYTFVMRDDCDLTLVKAGRGVQWESGTAGKGNHCFLRLNHKGQLTVEDDRYKTVWVSGKAAGKMGDYVLIMQINGQAVVYGPMVWSTASS